MKETQPITKEFEKAEYKAVQHIHYVLFRKNVNRAKKTLLSEIEALAASQGILAEKICQKALRYRNELVKKQGKREQVLPEDIAVYGEVEEFLEILHKISKNQ